jgi:hypothetical protein
VIWIQYGSATVFKYLPGQMAETQASRNDTGPPDWEKWPYNQPGSAVLLEKTSIVEGQMESLFHRKTTFIELWEPCSGKHRGIFFDILA